MDTSKIEEAEVVFEKKVFNPDANYEWKPTDQFNISGAELNVLHNTLHIVFNTTEPEPKKWVMLSKLYELTSGVIKRGVEGGIIQEVKRITAPPIIQGEGEE